VRAQCAADHLRPVEPDVASECTAEQAYTWSRGKALFASGSPFDPVTYEGKTYVSRQGNNSYIFPGVGLGVVTMRATRVSDAMFMTAAKTLAHTVSEEDLAQGSLYPALSRVRDVSAQIAAAVGEVALREGVAQVPRPDDMLAFMRASMYEPKYESYVD
jgi:malate dehydrogenase (oxaloacetate-decarboxylating)(NADP+)